MTVANQCPHCGKALPPASLGGLCPQCMIAAAFPTGGGSLSDSSKPVPGVQEIASYFPNLEILDCLGRGGMGILYRARQPQLNRIIALKILAPEKEHDPSFGERFTREAQALARLNHPNIVTVYDFGRADGLYFLLMEFVEGVNLRELMRSGRIKPSEALSIVPKICEALQFAHEHGIVHRDIKPENILLDKHGRVKIADFGIAKLMGVETQEALTHLKQTMGTPHYMAPEQVEHPETVDHRADIYSLGVVFYEMLTGELPLGNFPKPSRKVELDVRLDEIVLRALEKEPERRYQQAQAVKTDIETIVANRTSAHVTPQPQPAQSSRSTALLSRLALGLFLLGTLGTLLLLSVARRDTYVLIFGALALLMTLVFAAMSWREKLSRRLAVTTLALAIGIGVSMGVLAEVIPSPFRARIRAEAEKAQLQALAEQTEAHRSIPANDTSTSPPVIIETFPVAGSSEIDPSLDHIRVTFSKPMLNGSWSFVQLNNDTFPPMTGDPQFRDEQTCWLPVKLQPGRTYALWLNSDQFKNFKDQDGRTAVPYLLVFKTKR